MKIITHYSFEWKRVLSDYWQREETKTLIVVHTVASVRECMWLRSTSLWDWLRKVFGGGGEDWRGAERPGFFFTCTWHVPPFPFFIKYNIFIYVSIKKIFSYVIFLSKKQYFLYHNIISINVFYTRLKK